MCTYLIEHCEIAYLITLAINIIKIIVPVVLVIVGMIDFAKAVSSKDAEAMATARKNFLKRCLAGATVFFVIAFVQLAINLVAKAVGGQDTDVNSIWDCVDQLINYTGNC